MAEEPANAPGPNDPTYPKLSLEQRCKTGLVGGVLNAGVGVACNPGCVMPKPSPSFRPTLNPSMDLTGLETRGLQPLPGTRQIPEGIPAGWRIRPTREKPHDGTWYYDPANKGNAVRVMQGDPASPFPNSQAPYVRCQQNGQALDINGNVVPKNTPDAHIPLQDFKLPPNLFK